MRACLYGRLPGALADAGAAPARRCGGARDLPSSAALCHETKCEFGLQELGFLGHQLSKYSVSVDPRKVQSVVEWATSTSCCWTRAQRCSALWGLQATTAASWRATPRLWRCSRRWAARRRASRGPRTHRQSSTRFSSPFPPHRYGNPDAARRGRPPGLGGIREPQAHGSETELPDTRPLAAGGGPCATGISHLPTGCGAARPEGCWSQLDWLRSADGQPGDHVAQDEPASQQDVAGVTASQAAERQSTAEW